MGSDSGGYGGTEVKQVLIAKELKAIGFNITFLVHDYGQSQIVNCDGITIIKTTPYGIENKRGSFYRSIYSIWKAMQIANADVYFKRAAGPVTGIIALYCKIFKKRFIYAVASSYDIDGGYLRQSSFRDRILHNFGFNVSEKIILQVREYKNLLNQSFVMKSIVIPDAFQIPDLEEIVPIDQRKYFLFIGALRPVKRPDIFIELASEFPENKFVMIGGPLADIDYYNMIKKRTNKIENLDFLGHVTRDKIGFFISNAIALINTSDREGLPNTVTESWSYGVPVISLNINPDGLIEKLGYFCHNKKRKLSSSIQDILYNHSNYKKLKNKSRAYVEKYHRIADILKLYEKVINEN